MPTTNITPEILKSLLDYCHETGIFRWKVDRKGVKAGDIAGCIRKDPGNPYRLIQVCQRTYGAHRLAWLYMTGKWPEDQIDHINQVKSDNRFCNLREVDTVGNARNRKRPADNTSGCIGVNWHRRDGKWQAKITIHGKTLFLGKFTDIEDAIYARKQAEIDHGFHSNHGS